MYKYLVLILSLITLFACSGKNSNQIHTKKILINQNSQLKREFKKTGWISKKQYRALIYIVTLDECKNSSQGELKEKIKYEAIIALQRSLGDGFNRKRHSAIKNLVNNYGKVLVTRQECVMDNVYVLDIIKEDLKEEFYRIKSIK